MSGKRPMHQSFLYGRPVTEWSTPPPLAPLEMEKATGLHLELGNMNLDLGSGVPHKMPTPQMSSDAKSITQVPHHPTTSDLPKAHYATNTSQHTLSSCRTSSDFKPFTSKHMVHHVTPRRQQKVPSSTSLPTALVTPLPGTSPPQQTNELHGRVQQTCRMSVELDGENEGQHKSGRWKAVKGDEHELSGVSEGENTVELIEKWKNLIDTKDNIMKQKNIQIERQKTTISKLQQDTHELEAKLHHMMVAQVRRHGGSDLEARLQALEAENSSIRAQLTEALSSRNVDICTLSKKLDHKEYELHQAMKDHKQSSEERQQQIVTLQNEICKQQKCIRELEQKLAGSEAASKHHIEQLDRLNEYMGHMPSMDEHRTLEKQSREMQLECDTLTKHLVETKSSLNDALDQIKSKDILLCSLEGVKSELEDTRMSLESHKQTLAVVEAENRKWKQDNERMQKVVVEAERRCRQELQAMRERHRARFMEATAKLRSQYKHLAKRARALEAQLTRNSDAMMALNSELQCSQGTIGALKTSVKDLVSQNQELIEKNISLQEQTTEAMKVSSSISEAQSSAAQQLGVELSQCMEDFESLVGLSMSLLDGQEPTSTMLFGTDGHLLSSSMELSADCRLEARLDQVKHLRTRIEELRTMISEQFAAQLSSVCNVQ